MRVTEPETTAQTPIVTRRFATSGLQGVVKFVFAYMMLLSNLKCQHQEDLLKAITPHFKICLADQKDAAWSSAKDRIGKRMDRTPCIRR